MNVNRSALMRALGVALMIESGRMRPGPVIIRARPEPARPEPAQEAEQGHRREVNDKVMLAISKQMRKNAKRAEKFQRDAAIKQIDASARALGFR